MTISISVAFPNINKPVIDRNGMCDPEWYHFFEKLLLRTGGASGSDFVAAHATSIQELDTEVTGLTSTKADKTITISAGNGLTGGGNLSANRTLSAKKDTGWTASTGAGSKGVYVSYGGQTMGVAYVQAAAQQTDDAVKTLSARVVALEEALRANGGIDG